jgi:hypothetical protein
MKKINVKHEMKYFVAGLGILLFVDGLIIYIMGWY